MNEMPVGPLRVAPITFDTIGEAWKGVRSNSNPWVLAILTTSVVQYAVNFALTFTMKSQIHAVTTSPVPGLTPGLTPPPSTGAALGMLGPIMLVSWVASWLISTFFLAGTWRMAINQIKTGEAKYSDLFSGGDVYGKMLVVTLLTGLAVGIGSCFCLLPGIVVAGLLILAQPLVVDKGLGPVQALNLSWDTLKGQWIMAGVYIVVVGFVAMVGIFACGLGLLLTIPTAYLAIAYTYRNFFLSNPEAPPQTGQPYLPIADPSR